MIGRPASAPADKPSAKRPSFHPLPTEPEPPPAPRQASPPTRVQEMTHLLSALHPSKPPPAPAFVSLPLSSDAALTTISRQLSSREHRRQELGAPTCQVDQSGRPKLVLPSNGDGASGADPFSVNVGHTKLHQTKNRSASHRGQLEWSTKTADQGECWSAGIVTSSPTTAPD